MCKNNFCAIIGIILGIVFGAVVGILFAFDVIQFITTVVWIVFGLGVLILILLILGLFIGAATGHNALSKCLHKYTSCLLTGVLGTIIFSIISLAIVLDNTLIAVITIIAILFLFVTVMTVGLINLILCITNKLGSTI